MFKFIKNWLGKSEQSSQAEEFCPSANFQNATAAPPVEHFNGNGHGVVAVREDVLELPLAAVFAKLPQDLQARVRLPVNGEALVTVPRAVIVPQLSRGSIKISFGELRSLAPANTFYSQTDRDTAVVELPLPEIFARLNPALLARRQQKSMDVPEEITSPFSGHGEGLHFYKPEPASAYTRRVEENLTFTAASEFPTRGQIMSVPPPQPSQSSAPISMPGPTINRVPPPPPTSELVQAAAQPHAGDTGAALRVSLVELAENWLPAVRAEMAEMNLLDASLTLPLAMVEEALKKGRAVFSWKQVRAWTNSPAAGVVSSHDSTLLDLPLRVLAPLFLAQRFTYQPRPKAVADESIPDVFNFSKNGSTAPAHSGNTDRIAAPKPAGNTDRISAPPKPAAPKEKDIFDEVSRETGKARVSDGLQSGTEFLKRYATPNDIVRKAVTLGGVAGALVALPDGLLVASELPPTANADALAAFMPQVCGRVAQSAREYRVGELKDLAFTVGETPWRIFKVGSIFLGVFGRAGETLPTRELSALAAELDRKPRQI